MRNCFALAIFLLLGTTGFSQDPDELPFETGRMTWTPARLFGKVVDSKNNKGIEAASVQVFSILRDPANNPIDSLLAGMLTKPNGDFSFINLSLPDTFVVKFSAIGYRGLSETVLLNRNGNERSNFERDMGNIKIGHEAEFLGAVTVTATRPPLQLGIDRKIFNVDKSLTSTGGTAIDVIRNIPSLSVDVEGNVQLRGSSPQVFVDGRPTILTLEQIPADDIDRVEIITNPSSRFDAASSGGIINVVLKKNRRFGLNGVASAGVGTPGILNGNLSLNLRQGKLNFFASGNYNRWGGVAKSESFRQNKVNGVPADYFNQVSENERLRQFVSARFGIDYFMDNRNTLSISQNFVTGRFENNEKQDQDYRSSEAMLLRTGQRFSDGNAKFDRSNTQLNYRHSFPKSGHELTADVTYNTGGRVNSSVITNYFLYPGNGMPDYRDTNVIRNNGSNDNTQLTFQVDYIKPLSETSKLETGLRAFNNDQTSLFNVFSVTGNTESKLPLSNNYEFKESIYAGYITYTNKIGSVGYQAGLRAEYSKFTGKLVDSARSFGYELPEDIGGIWDGLFPSLYLTKPITEEAELQLNFSRRIRRPNFWQLNPFVDIDDPLNISQGNPAIRPEYVNSFEFNYSHRYEKGSFLGSLYFRNNQGDITRYSDTITAAQYRQLNNAGIDPNAILNTFINAQFTNRMGAEFTVQQKFGNLEIIPSVNFQYRKVKAVVRDLNLNNEGFNWQAELTSTYRFGAPSGFFKNMHFQMSGEYESPEIIPQGKNKEQYEVDIAFRKEFLKDNAATITLAVNDVFNSDRFGQIYDTEAFYQDSYRRWNVRNYRLTLSYRFGDKDFNLFRRPGGDRGNGEDD